MVAPFLDGGDNYNCECATSTDAQWQAASPSPLHHHRPRAMIHQLCVNDMANFKAGYFWCNDGDELTYLWFSFNTAYGLISNPV